METLNKTIVGKHYIAPFVLFLPIIFYAVKFRSFQKAYEKLGI